MFAFPLFLSARDIPFICIFASDSPFSKLGHPTFILRLSLVERLRFFSISLTFLYYTKLISDRSLFNILPILSSAELSNFHLLALLDVKEDYVTLKNQDIDDPENLTSDRKVMYVRNE